MSLGRVLYRARQFYLALRAANDPRDLEQARSVLTPAQVALFSGMQSSEQAHAVSVYRQLVAQGETSSDLWQPRCCMMWARASARCVCGNGF